MNTNPQLRTENIDNSYNADSIKVNDSNLDATYDLSILYRLSNDFEQTKKYLNRFGNYYINYLFSLLGYQFKGRIVNPNLLHVTAQAWILGVLEEMKREENLDKEIKISYSLLLKKIKEIIVEEKTFIENSKLLIGIYGLKDYELKYDQVLKIFLVHIQETKNQISIDNEEITKKQFQEVLMRILRSAFNFSLNDFNSIELNKKSLDLLNIYLEFVTIDQNEELTFDRFKNYYYEKKPAKENSFTEEEQKKINLQLYYYFAFCQTKFEDLIQEIDLFNHNANSVMFKLKTFVSMRNLKGMFYKYYDLISNNLEKGLRNMRLESVINFYRFLVKEVAPIKEKAVEYVVHKYSDGRQWIDSTVRKYEDYYAPYLNNFKNYSARIYEGSMHLIESPKQFLYQKIYKPVNHLTLSATNNSIDLIIDTLRLGKEKTENLNKFVKEKVSHTVDGVKSSLFGEDPIVKVGYESEKKEYMTISISKKLFLIDPQSATNLIKNIIEKMKNFSIKETGISAINYTKEKVSNAKNYVICTYRKFLELSEEDNECEDKNIKID